MVLSFSLYQRNFGLSLAPSKTRSLFSAMHSVMDIVLPDMLSLPLLAENMPAPACALNSFLFLRSLLNYSAALVCAKVEATLTALYDSVLQMEEAGYRECF
jgi:hypothetical protein